METMRAVRIHSYGGPEVMKWEKVPLPDIKADEVLVKVHAAGINPVDWKVREGYLQEMMGHALPLIPGWEMSGTVASAGSDVTAFQIGDAVFAHTDISQNGAYAEFIAIKAVDVAFKPHSLDHVEAAAVPLAALTAWQSLFELACLTPGQKVLIHAASGGVGHYAVQFAKWQGAHVIGTSSSVNVGFLLQLGAHEVIDYTAMHFEEVVHEVDVVLDTRSGDTRDRSWRILKRGGILVTTLPPLPDKSTVDSYGVRSAHVFVRPNSEQLGEIAELIDSGHVKPIVQQVFPLEKAGQAQELSKGGHVRGKLVLRVTP